MIKLHSLKKNNFLNDNGLATAFAGDGGHAWPEVAASSQIWPRPDRALDGSHRWRWRLQIKKKIAYEGRSGHIRPPRPNLAAATVVNNFFQKKFNWPSTGAPGRPRTTRIWLPKGRGRPQSGRPKLRSVGIGLSSPFANQILAVPP